MLDLLACFYYNARFEIESGSAVEDFRHDKVKVN